MGAITQAQAQQEQRLAARPGNDFKSLLESQWDKIAAVAPRSMSQERLFQLAVSAYNQTPKLAECSPVSVLSCVMKCAALGMEPSAVDGLGRAYILPYRNGKTGRYEAQFMLGYRGMIDLARRSGQITDISARAVYEGDTFEFEYGLNETLRHVPGNCVHDKETLTHVYCVCHFKDGGHYIDVMTKAEVDAVRRRSKASNNGPWVTDYEAMACKTVIRRAFKYLPVSVEGADAVSADETTPTFEGIYQEPPAPAQEVPGNVDAETGEIVIEEATDNEQ